MTSAPMGTASSYWPEAGDYAAVSGIGHLVGAEGFRDRNLLRHILSIQDPPPSTGSR